MSIFGISPLFALHSSLFTLHSLGVEAWVPRGAERGRRPVAGAEGDLRQSSKSRPQSRGRMAPTDATVACCSRCHGMPEHCLRIILCNRRALLSTRLLVCGAARKGREGEGEGEGELGKKSSDPPRWSTCLSLSPDAKSEERRVESEERRVD